MKISPAKRIVVVKPTEIKSDSLIETVVVKEKDQPEIGEVVAVGKSAKKEDPPILMKPGDLIAYRRYGERKFFFCSEEYLFVGFDDVLGIIKKEK